MHKPAVGSDDSKPQFIEELSFDLRGRTVPRADPISKRASRVASSDRLYKIAERSLADVGETMASAAERHVNGTMGSQDGVVRDGNADALAQEIGRLQNELRRTQDINREITEGNKQLAKPKKIPSWVVAPKPFMGKTSEQDPLDWLAWFEKYCEYKMVTNEEKSSLFVMMLQGSAADWINGFLRDTVRTPSFHTLKSAFSENYFKAKELRWRDARSMWHEVKGVTERVADYIARM
jgi:hypothetical protein